MNNMVKNAYRAYRIDNISRYGSYIAVQGASFSAEEFALDMWFYISEGGNVLLSQKNGFAIGIDSDKIIFKHPVVGTQVVKNDILKIGKGSWNNLYMGYDEEEISFYVNGLKFGTVCCHENLRNTEEFIVGAEFTGYIRSLRLYDKTIAENDYKNYCFASTYNAATMPGMVAFMDFTQETISDLSSHGVSAEVYGGCVPMDLVDVYLPSAGKYAYVADSAWINPGGFESGQFSVYVKLYIRPAGNRRMVLVSNDSSSESDRVVIFAEKTQSGTGFGICLGEKEYTFAAGIGEYAWVDVIFAVNEKEVIAYINGTKYSQKAEKFCRNQIGDFKIGGRRNGTEAACEHYFHSIAVFDRVLGETEAADFMANHPFVLEDGLVALINFEGGSADELVSGTSVCVEQSGLFPAQRTVDQVSDMPYQFRVNYTGTALSDMKKWEADLLLEEYKGFVEETFGLGCAAGLTVFGVLAVYLSHNKAILKGISDLYMKPKVSSESAAKAMSKIPQGISKTLYKALGVGTGSVAGAASGLVGMSGVVSAGTEYLSLFLLGCGAVAAAAAVISAAVTQKHEDKPEKDDGEQTTVKLLSMTLQHTPDDHTGSAVRCRDYKGVITGAEWTEEGKCTAPAVYIADEIKKVKIKIKFKISAVSTKQKGSYRVTLNAFSVNDSKGLFGDFKYEQAGLVAEKEYEIELESSSNAVIAANFQYIQAKLWWNCYVDQDPVSLPNTMSDIYIIPTRPCAPILLDQNCDENFIRVEYLKLCTRMLGGSERTAVCGAEQNNLQVGATFDELKRITTDLYASPYFKYAAGASRYIESKKLILSGKVCGTQINFKTSEFQEHIANFEPGNTVEIECEVYAAILCYLFRMKGISCRLAYVLNPEGVGQPESGRYDQLHVEGVYPAGDMAAAQNLDFIYHMIVEVPPQRNLTGMDGVRVFDASMGILKDGRITPLAGYPFAGQNTTRVNAAAEQNTYRGMVIRNNTGAIISSDNYVFVQL